jgi:ACS family glucarate transporter-like MFS transporter
MRDAVAATIVNYADRATIAIAGPVLSKDLGFSPVQMGHLRPLDGLM